MTTTNGRAGRLKALRTGLLSAAMAVALLASDPGVAPASAQAVTAGIDWSKPARAQFWEREQFEGDKLDKDAPGREADLGRLGRDCFIWCQHNWKDVISSIDTTGRGQPGAWLAIFDQPQGNGQCVLIPPGQTLPLLYLFVVRGRETRLEWWGRRIESFEVFSRTPDLGRCGQLLQR